MSSFQQDVCADESFCRLTHTYWCTMLHCALDGEILVVRA